MTEVTNFTQYKLYKLLKDLEWSEVYSYCTGCLAVLYVKALNLALALMNQDSFLITKTIN
jgi:hypothetical protein